MAEVILKYRGGLADSIGRLEENTDANTVADILEMLKKSYGKQVYKTARSMVICVNGIGILKLNVLKTKLSDGDEVQFLPISGGG